MSGAEFDKRTGLVAGLVNYFSNLSNLNNNELWRPLFRKKRVGFGFLDLCTKILNKNNEATQVIPALKALSNILDMKLEAQANIPGETNVRASLLSVRVEEGGAEGQVVEHVVGGILTSMKRYPGNEKVQHNGIDVMKKMAAISSELVNGMLKKGATRMLISKLEEEFSSPETVRKTLILLDKIGEVVPDSL